jgi:acetyl-CoA acetyltransferase
MTDDVWIIGVQMTRFGRYPECDAVDLAFEAAAGALEDSQLAIADVDVIASGSLMGGAIGQAVQKQLGQTAIPVYNVINACATGATAIRTAYMAIASGEADIGLAIGAEKMGKAGLLGVRGADDDLVYRASGRTGAVLPTEGVLGTELMPALFSHAATDYLRRNPGVPERIFAEIAAKNHANSVHNPLAMYQKPYTVEEILASPMVTSPNTVLMCGPTCDGAAAAVLVSDKRLRQLDPAVRRRAVRIAASVMTSDPWAEGSDQSPDLNTLTAIAAHRAYERAGVGPQDLDLVELHDCFATAELLHYENLGLCEPGGAPDLFWSGATASTGRLPVNSSGGLVSKGHPLGATGIANVYEVTTQLRHEAGARQVDGARRGLTHVVGLGSSCVVHVLERVSTT